MVKAALYYALKLGWPVFPVWPIRNGRCACGRKDCHSPGKHPIASVAGEELAARGVLDATLDEELIRRWWDIIPDANIGGRGVEWFALDVDDLDALFEIRNNYGEIPDTPQSFSGGGGVHLFFKQPAEPYGNSEGALPYGINVRGINGYVLLAPSNHVRGEYIWEVSSKPTDVPLADPPDWLVKLLSDSVKAEPVTFSTPGDVLDLYAIDISDVIREDILRAPMYGEDRSQTAQRVITALLDAGCTDSQIRDIFIAYPIGTHGKYAEKGDNGDAWLALSIGKAKSWLSTHSSSKAIPGKIISREEAKIEDRVLREIYKKGWHDALTAKMELLKLWPNYLGLNDEGLREAIVDLFDVGVRTDYTIDGVEYATLTVPMSDANDEVYNIDYSLYSGPIDRAWESCNIPLFVSDKGNVGARRLVLLDDWDTAAYVYLAYGHLLTDTLLASISEAADVTHMNVSNLGPLLSLARESDEIVFVSELGNMERLRWLASWLELARVRCVRWPYAPRKMFSNYGMDGERFKRALRGAVPIC